VAGGYFTLAVSAFDRHQARELAVEKTGGLRQGKDPQEEKRRGAKPSRLAELCESYIEQYAKGTRKAGRMTGRVWKPTQAGHWYAKVVRRETRTCRASQPAGESVGSQCDVPFLVSICSSKRDLGPCA